MLPSNFTFRFRDHLSDLGILPFIVALASVVVPIVNLRAEPEDVVIDEDTVITGLGIGGAEELVVLEGATLTSYVVEVTGTYDGGMSGPMDVPGYMLLGGIVEGPDAPWFFKFIGPEETVRDQRGAFLEMMESIRTDG